MLPIECSRASLRAHRHEQTQRAERERALGTRTAEINSVYQF